MICFHNKSFILRTFLKCCYNLDTLHLFWHFLRLKHCHAVRLKLYTLPVATSQPQSNRMATQHIHCDYDWTDFQKTRFPTVQGITRTFSVYKASRQWVFALHVQFNKLMQPPFGLFSYTETGMGTGPSRGRFTLDYTMATVVLCTQFNLHRDGDRSLFLNGYCTHFKDTALSLDKGSVSASVYVNEPL